MNWFVMVFTLCVEMSWGGTEIVILGANYAKVFKVGHRSG
jgi:hypothetical protein